MATRPMRQVVHQLRASALAGERAARTDEQLLRAFASHRDEGAFAALVTRHGPMVWSVCRRMLGHQQDTEDAFQATFLVLTRKARSITSAARLASWLHGVAHNVARKAQAQAARRRSREINVPRLPEPETQAREPAHDWLPLLDRELCCLADRYRTVLVLCDLEGKTRREAARMLQVPEGTVAGRLARARALLAKRLTRHGAPIISAAALTGALLQSASAAPTTVVSATLRAINLWCVGQATGAISAPVAVLAEGVLKAMLLSKLKIGVAVVSTIAILLGITATWVGVTTQAGEEPAQPAQQAKPAEKSKPGPPVADANAEFLIFRLQQANATDTARILQELLQGKEAEGLRIVADPVSNSLLVRGKGLQRNVVEALILRLDEAVDAKKPAPPPEPAAKIEISLFPLRYARAVDIAKTLQELLQEKDAEPMRIAADPGSNGVAIRGRPEQIDAAKELIRRLDDAAATRATEQKIREDMVTQPARPQPTRKPTAVIARQGQRELKFAAGISTQIEGLSLALLGTCGSEAKTSKVDWSSALQGDCIRIQYGEPRSLGVSTGDGEVTMTVSEIVLPMSATQPPGHIFIRAGEQYRAFTRYQPQEVLLLQHLLKNLPQGK